MQTILPLMKIGLRLCVLCLLYGSVAVASPGLCLDDTKGIEAGQLKEGPHYLLYPSTGPVSLRLHVPVGVLDQSPKEQGAATTLAYLFENLCTHFGQPMHTEVLPHDTIYKVDNITPDLMNVEINELHRIASSGLLVDETLNSNRYKTPVETLSQGLNQEQEIEKKHQAFLFKGTPLAYPHIDCMDRGTLETFHAEHYRLVDMTLIATGDFKTEILKTILEKQFIHSHQHPHPVKNSSRPHKREDTLHIEIQHAEIEVEAHIDSTIKEISIFIETLEKLENKACRNPAEHIEAIIKKEIESAFINEYLSETLANIEGMHHCDFVYKNTLPTLANWQIRLRVAPEAWQASITHIGHIISNLIHKGALNETLFERAKDHVRAHLIANQNIFINGCAKDQADALLMSHIQGLSEIDLLKVTDEIQHIIHNLTLAECIQDFEALWHNSPTLIFAMGPLPFSDSKTAELAIEKAYLESLTTLPPEEKSTYFAYENFGEWGEITQHHYFNKHAIHHFRFKNGLKLNVAGGDNPPFTLAALKFGQGYQGEDPAFLGLTWFTEAAFLKGGLGQHSWQEIESYLEEHDLQLWIETQANGFLLKGKAPKANLEKLLYVMTAYMSDPGFRLSALPDIKEGLAKRYNARNTAMGLIKERLMNLSHGDDRRFHTPTPLMMEAWDMDIFKKRLLDDLKSRDFELSIVGNYLKDTDGSELHGYVLGPVAGSLGALPKLTNKNIIEPVTKLNLAETPPIQYLTYPGGNNEIAIACIYWKTLDDYDREIFRPLRVLARLYTNAVKKRLEESWGDAYDITSFSEGGIHVNKGVIGFYIAVAPEDVENVMTLMVQVAQNLTDAVHIRREIFEATLSGIITQVGEEFIQTAQKSGKRVNAFHGELRPRLETLINTARQIVNIPDLSTEAVIRALRADLSIIGNSMNLLSAYTSAQDLEATLKRYIHDFTKKLEQHIINQSEAVTTTEKIYKWEAHMRLLFSQKSKVILKLTRLYSEANRQAFVVEQEIQSLFSEIIPKINTIEEKKLIEDYIQELQNAFSPLLAETIVDSPILEAAINKVLKTIHELETIGLKHDIPLVRIESMIEPHRLRLTSLLESIIGMRQQIKDIRQTIKNQETVMYDLLQTLTLNTDVQTLKDCLRKDFYHWIEKGKILAHYQLAAETLEKSKQDAVWAAWKLLNPYYPSDGSINPEDNTLEKAIREELAPLTERLHTPEYWLQNVLTGSQEHPERLLWAENLIQDYHNTSVKDLILLIRLFLNPETAGKIYITPEGTGNSRAQT